MTSRQLRRTWSGTAVCCGAAAAILILSLPGAAGAASLDAFQADLAPAYEKVRSAIFYLQRGAGAAAAVEAEGARDAWRRQVLPHADSPPGAFADDPAFASTLERIEAQLAAAVEAERPETALKALTGIPDRLAELRARNHVVVFADRVAEANRAMDRLWVYRHRDIDFSDRAALDDLRARLAVAQYAYEKCLNTAPAKVAGDPAFQRTVTGTLDSLELMWSAIADAEPATIVSILREVRSFDKLLWLNHG